MNDRWFNLAGLHAEDYTLLSAVEFLPVVIAGSVGMMADWAGEGLRSAGLRWLAKRSLADRSSLRGPEEPSVAQGCQTNPIPPAPGPRTGMRREKQSQFQSARGQAADGDAPPHHSQTDGQRRQTNPIPPRSRPRNGARRENEANIRAPREVGLRIATGRDATGKRKANGAEQTQFPPLPAQESGSPGKTKPISQITRPGRPRLATDRDGGSRRGGPDIKQSQCATG